MAKPPPPDICGTMQINLGCGTLTYCILWSKLSTTPILRDWGGKCTRKQCPHTNNHSTTQQP